MNAYSEAVFLDRIQSALRRIREILDDTRAPQVPSDVHHLYADKFLLAEHLTNVTWAALIQALEVLGLGEEQLATARAWSEERSVMLRFGAEERCVYDGVEVEEVESGTKVKEVRSKGIFGSSKKTVQEKVITKVKTYHWVFHVSWSIELASWSDPDARLTLSSGRAEHRISTSTKDAPRPERTARQPIEIGLRGFIDRLDPELRCAFQIDRDASLCYTPRRNPDVDAALAFGAQLYAGCQSIHHYVVNQLFGLQRGHGRDLSMINDAGVFVPVIPILTEPEESGDPVILGPEHTATLLAVQRRTLSETLARIDSAFPADGAVVAQPLARVGVALLHLQQLVRYHASSMAYLEAMLREQLRQAIGKLLTPDDFTEYMRFHERKLFTPEFEPVPFHHAVRRPQHVPEGVISLEQRLGGEHEAISTHLRRFDASMPMRIMLNAATEVELGGERCVHGWVAHRFSGASPQPLRLTARARQFSSFILLVGRIAAADRFEPRDAIIIQNKDDLRVPLILEEIPTPKEFKDAIESLSPEQQRFARAYRSMQLESTLFGVCVVQIKPALERLLNLPADSLTKEIELTQQLLELFITYQIPSDLLSYDGEEMAHRSHQVESVQGHVQRMLDMIQRTRDAELEDQRQRQQYDVAQASAETLLSAPQPQVNYSSGPGGPPPMETASIAFGGPPPTQGAAPPAPGGAPPPRPKSKSRRAPAPPPTPAAAAPPPVTERTAAVDLSPAPEPAASVNQDTPTGPQSAQPELDAELGDDVPAGEDLTRLPVLLDKRFEALDEDSALRPTIIKTGDTWTLRRQQSLLAEPETRKLGEEERREERGRAFDLLDALSRSGALPLDDASLHVIVAATHGFDRTLTETVIQRSVNPIEKVERSSLIVASTVHRQTPRALTRAAQHERLGTWSPALFPEPSEED